LAAAVQVGLQLKVGDFLELAQNDPQAQGLPSISCGYSCRK